MHLRILVELRAQHTLFLEQVEWFGARHLLRPGSALDVDDALAFGFDWDPQRARELALDLDCREEAVVIYADNRHCQSNVGARLEKLDQRLARANDEQPSRFRAHRQ